MFDPQYCSVNGQLLHRDSWAISPNDRGFTLGHGAFTTLRVRHGQACHFAAHWHRLRASCAALHILWTPSLADTAQALQACLAANGAPSQSSCGARLTITAGPAQRGLLPPRQQQTTQLIEVFALPPLPAALRLRIVSGFCHEQSPLSQHKTTNYLPNLLAKQNAVANGADDAILLNTMGRVAETSTGNLFLWANAKQLLTPPLHEGALPGITRQLLFSLAPQYGISVSATPICVEQLLASPEVVVTNALQGIQVVDSIDGRRLSGSAQQHAWSTQLQRQVQEHLFSTSSLPTS